MAYKVFFYYKGWINVKELGEKLSELRKNNGVTLEEASHDLSISSLELESLENGNFKAFKDVYELKNIIKTYSKYLGEDEEKILDEFNDFLFEKTSKISLDDLKVNKKEEEKEERVSSPYTKIKPSRYDYAPIVLIIVVLVFISLIIYLILAFFKDDDNINRELKVDERMVTVYELTQ